MDLHNVYCKPHSESKTQNIIFFFSIFSYVCLRNMERYTVLLKISTRTKNMGSKAPNFVLHKRSWKTQADRYEI
jgi:hypothetical protein